MLLANKVVLITGGAGLNGLGFATARQMANHGACVAIMDLEGAKPVEAAAQLGDEHLGVIGNVTDKAAIDRATLLAVDVEFIACNRAAAGIGNLDGRAGQGCA